MELCWPLRLLQDASKTAPKTKCATVFDFDRILVDFGSIFGRCLVDFWLILARCLVDVPLIFGSNYRDNWDLAAARSASVVQAFAANGTISEDRLEAISYGESRPVESNESAEGRAKNRRIEIEINY